MKTEGATKQKLEVNQPLEVAIQVGLAALLVIGCLLILWPFVPLIMWGVIIAIASYPTFLKLEKVVRGRRAIAASLWTLMLLAILILPLVLLAQGAIEGMRPIIAKIRDGSLVLTPPPPSVETWPIIGHSLARAWTAASVNLTDTILKFAPQIKSALPGLLSASAGFGFTIVQFLFAILLSGFMLANADSAYRATRALMNRLFGEQGAEFQSLIGATVRSVTFGILGVALIQSAGAAVGFYLFGLPGASVWSVVFVFAAVLQMGGLVLIPALVYYFAIASTAKAIAFLVWSAIVGLSDNILKPIFLGRRSPVPIVVVFLGVLGGFVAMGIIGLFVGAIVLSVGYKLLLAWIAGRPDTIAEA